jgi:hypothetical protein
MMNLHNKDKTINHLLYGTADTLNHHITFKKGNKIV